MSSTPTSTYLSTTSTPVVRSSHRHKRSGAISGDFDLAGLGLFSPNHLKHGASHTCHNSNPTYLAFNEDAHLSPHPNSFSYDSEQDTSTRQFHFSNEEDFTNEPSKEGFHFPSPHLLHTTSKGLESGRKAVYVKSNALNSPIRLKPKRSFSFNVCTSKLFLTDETLLDEHNVPDALIDLDRVLSASSAKVGTDILDDEKTRDTDCLDFPDAIIVAPPNRIPNTPTTLSVSPYSSPAYLKQPIKEPANDAIKEEEDNGDTDPNFREYTGCNSAKFITDDQINHAEGAALNLIPHEDVNLYPISLNSSASSLPQSYKQVLRDPSGTSIEKICSNTSREPPFTFIGVNGTPTPKRFSAKANRYQAFYEQSTKISSSLKISSSESIHFIPQFHLESSLIKEREVRPLEHSLSLPSLKSGKNRVSSAQSLEKDASRSSGIFDASSNVSDFVCTSCLQQAGVTPEHSGQSPNETPTKSLSRTSLPRQKVPLTQANTFPQSLNLGENSNSTPESEGFKFDELDLVHVKSPLYGDTSNFEVSRSKTPTIVVSSGVESTKSASSSVSKVSSPQVFSCEQDPKSNESCVNYNDNDLLQSATKKSTNLPIKTALPHVPSTGDGFSLTSKSKTKSKLKATKFFGSGITVDTSDVKTRRLSSWFKRMK